MEGRQKGLRIVIVGNLAVNRALWRGVEGVSRITCAGYRCPYRTVALMGIITTFVSSSHWFPFDLELGYPLAM